MLVYIYITGIFTFLHTFYTMNYKKEKVEKVKEKYDSKYDFGFCEIPHNLVYIVALFFGWIIVPLSIVDKLYTLVTGKELF